MISCLAVVLNQVKVNDLGSAAVPTTCPLRSELAEILECGCTIAHCPSRIRFQKDRLITYMSRQLMIVANEVGQCDTLLYTTAALYISTSELASSSNAMIEELYLSRMHAWIPTFTGTTIATEDKMWNAADVCMYHHERCRNPVK